MPASLASTRRDHYSSEHGRALESTRALLWPVIRLSASGSGFAIGGGSAIYGLANTGPNYNFAEDVSLVKGAHEIGVGGNYIHILLNSKTGLNATGAFTFNGQTTGLSLADFLVGKASAWSQGNLAQYWNRSYDRLALLRRRVENIAAVHAQPCGGSLPAVL
jgi:hypothetical protein